MWRVGTPPSKLSIAQPLPVIHARPGWAAAYAAIRLRYSAGPVASLRSHSPSSVPPKTACTCASWNPGISNFPARSTTSVFGPINCRTSSCPTAVIRSPVTARLLALVRAGPLVRTGPPVRTRSAWTVLLMGVGSVRRGGGTGAGRAGPVPRGHSAVAGVSTPVSASVPRPVVKYGDLRTQRAQAPATTPEAISRTGQSSWNQPLSARSSKWSAES